MDELYIEPCCQYRYTERRDRVNEDIRREAEALRQALVEDEHRGTGRVIRTRRWLWNFLEKPQTSIVARVRMIASLDKEPGAAAGGVHWLAAWCNG